MIHLKVFLISCTSFPLTQSTGLSAASISTYTIYWSFRCISFHLHNLLVFPLHLFPLKQSTGLSAASPSTYTIYWSFRCISFHLHNLLVFPLHLFPLTQSTGLSAASLSTYTIYWSFCCISFHIMNHLFITLLFIFILYLLLKQHSFTSSYISSTSLLSVFNPFTSLDIPLG